MNFDYVLQVLSIEIDRLNILKKNDEKKEIQAVIEMLNKGQGYLTNTKPKKIIFYDEL